ncbi:histone chaperone domain CHZ-domain-containing protein [Podospora didyma]|uniref:Histone chaperone domain CHZ-domain-containing protein n=1 Tax=Podospora didyma TaxID=330526 RepID=A0AAE0U210_9PEZI|nr:histone chaperone domain CHZ-domain-containing protein [Podospora didyma]
MTENGATTTSAAQELAAENSKGKGKAPAQEDVVKDTEMGDDDDEDDEEEDNDEEAEVADEEDGLEEIDLDNVIGRRTRGKVIDFAKAAEENPAEADEDEEDDDDFEVEDEKMDED